MVQKRPYIDLPWDQHSDQPHILPRPVKQALRAGTWPEHLWAALTAVLGLPVVTARMLTPQLRLQRSSHWHDFCGCGVSPRRDRLVHDAVAELGLKHLLVRVFVHDAAARAAALRLIESMPQQRWLVVFPQDRRAVCNPTAFAAEMATLAADLPPQVHAVQIGNAVNRSKWGCATLAEFLPLQQACVHALRAVRPDLLISGSSVIDFEPIATMRSLFSAAGRLDATSALLYVDRRGGPDGRQYGVFDFAAKLRFVASVVQCSPFTTNRLWLTEVNWPLSGTAPWAPTSEAECVSEQDAAKHLSDYLRIAYNSGLVERCYPWQLVAPGYGLIDDRDGLRYRASYEMLKQLMQQPTL